MFTAELFTVAKIWKQPKCLLITRKNVAMWWWFSSVAQLCPTLCDPINCSMPGLPVHHQLPEFTQTHAHRVSDAISHLILCCPFLLLPPIPPSIRIFSNESTLHMRCGQSFKVSASASVLPVNMQNLFPSGWTGWISLQPLKSLLQHHSSKASIFLRSAFFTVQLTHPYMTPGKTIALTRQTFVGKVMSLFFTMLSKLVIIFLPRSKSLLISWLQSPSAVILEPHKIKSWHCFHYIVTLLI